MTITLEQTNLEPVSTIPIEVTCINCLYHRGSSTNKSIYCSSPLGSVNTTWLDLDTVEEKYPDLSEDKLEAKGWAEQCKSFFPIEPSLEEEEYLPDVDTAAADSGWEPF